MTGPPAGRTAPCNHCGGPVPLPDADRGEDVVRCGFCGAALLVHVRDGVRWTEEVARLERREAKERALLEEVVRLRRRRAARRAAAPAHTATDWRGVQSGCGFAAFGSLFLAGALVGVVFLVNEGPSFVLLHVLAFGGVGTTFVALGLRHAWAARRVTVRADGSRETSPETSDPFA